MLPLCAACLALSVWMVIQSRTGMPMAGCGAGSGCDSVMGSPWAYVAGGIPVSLPAAVVYLLMIVCVLFLDGNSGDGTLDIWVGRLMALLGGCLVGAAVWFCFLQAGVLHAFCPYCTALHLAGCVVAVLAVLRERRQGRRPWILFAAGLAAAAVLALVQLRTVPKTVYDSGRSGAELPVFADGEVPVLGEGSGETLTLLFDFQCIHCRRLHRVLPGLLAQTGLRIRLCPVPLSGACNPYIPADGIDRFAGSCRLTRLALAVWYAAPDRYAEYWDALLPPDDRRVDPEEAERLARSLLGAGFGAACADPRVEDYLKRVYELFGRTSTSGKSGVPRLVWGQRWLVPEADDAGALAELLRTEWPDLF